MSKQIAEKAREYAMDLRRYQRQEQIQGHLSPTDAALLTRILEFLERDVAVVMDKAGNQTRR